MSRIIYTFLLVFFAVTPVLAGYTEAQFKQKILDSLSKKPDIFNKLLEPCSAVIVAVSILSTRDAEVKKQSDKGIQSVVSYLENENQNMKPLPPDKLALTRKFAAKCKW